MGATQSAASGFSPTHSGCSPQVKALVRLSPLTETGNAWISLMPKRRWCCRHPVTALLSAPSDAADPADPAVRVGLAVGVLMQVTARIG
jgi:hypothetical protein